MRIDIEYIKDFLEIVLDIDQPDFTFDHEKIKPLWESEEKLKNFAFHIEILEDQDLIVNTVSDKGSINRAGGIHLRINPMRLTADGHQFASDLNKPGISEKLATSFKEAGPKEVVKIVFDLGKKALEKKISELTE